MSKTAFTGATADDYVIPVSDGSFYTADMSSDSDDSYMLIRFYSDAAGSIPVAAGSVLGDIEFCVSADDDSHRYRTISNGSFNAAIVDDPDRPLPKAFGPVTKAKLTLANITGAAYFRAWVVRQ